MSEWGCVNVRVFVFNIENELKIHTHTHNEKFLPSIGYGVGDCYEKYANLLKTERSIYLLWNWTFSPHQIKNAHTATPPHTHIETQVDTLTNKKLNFLLLMNVYEERFYVKI